MKKINYFLGSFLVIIVLFAACAKDKVNFDPNALTLADCTDSISFVNDVKPIIEQNCSTSGCHDAASSGGYQFVTYAQISAGAEVIFKSMNHAQGISPMPQGAPKLSDAQIKTVGCWNLQGRLNN